MVIKGEFTLNLPVGGVWDLLLSPACLKSCIPGCESLMSKNEREFDGVINVRIGPIKTRFKVRVSIIEKQPPISLISKVFGKGMLGEFIQKNRLDLEKVDIDQTKLTYTSDLNITGKIATFGERIFKAKAKEMQDKFWASFNNYSII